jgi:hypothetical protein
MPLFREPYPDCPNETRIRVQAEIDPDDYKLLFRKVVGIRGCQEPIVGTLIKALVAEIKKTKYGIPDNYDDDNFGKIQSIIDRVNFNPVGLIAGEADLDTVEEFIRFVQTPSKQTVARRPDRRAARSTSSRDERSGAKKVHSGHKDDKNVAPDTKGKTTG